MRITTNGQVTIPREIRELLGLLPHTEVAFEVRGDELILRKAESTHRGPTIAERLRGRGDVALSTDQILSMTRGGP